ncbi:heat shock 70 kDa protein 12A [Phanerochaete sordida]|uniref:Heat shock 70 kDa protein 12A n=1 Tax=Phanerochaete sordida TaxID=48140 RepID=A0A9P3LEX9_9APHY|nr:heat shock 70 kDa protein 12A [Phanerochaete sordida]
MPGKTPYKGTSRSLVLGIDIGTTFSGVSYAFLDPGEIPKIQIVTRFPGQENVSAKIPSILYYSDDGTMFAAGAEAVSPAMRLEAEDRNLTRAEWWKLHLCPDALVSDELRQRLPPLPDGKDAVSILADMLAYLFSCTRVFITESHPLGESMWSSAANDIQVVLSHPNGWEGPQQEKMRQAAVIAGLVPDTIGGRDRVHVVTEGEASLHYCIERGILSHALQDGETVIIADAGGGTVDVTTYGVVTADPIVLQEVAAPECLLEGSTMINERMECLLKTKLAKSRYGNSEDIMCMLESFEKTAKPTFRDDKDRSYIKFGSIRDNDPDFKIRSGQIVLEGSEVAACFAPSVMKIIDTVHAQRLMSGRPISKVILVGGYADSPWLHMHLQRALKDVGITVCRPESHANKAVAEGATSFYLEHFVSGRVARFAYGTMCVVEYNPQDSDHVKRRGKAYTRPSGRTVIPNSFNMILAKGTCLRENDEVCSQGFYKEASSAAALKKISTTIVCYRGSVKAPRWTDAEPERFSTLCTIFADTTQVKKEKKTRDGCTYYALDFKVVLLCGSTEMKAMISWMDDGKERRGPAKIVYDDDTEVSLG